MITITVDPNSEIPPNYMSDEHAIARVSLMRLRDGMTNEEAAGILLENWHIEWERRKTRWIEERTERETTPYNPNDDYKVFLRDSEGNLVSRFYNYGLIDWEQLYACLTSIICTSTPPWAIFKDMSHGQGPLCSPGPGLPESGNYIILSPSGSPIRVNLISQRARPRHPTISNTGNRAEHYRRRVRARDHLCLISGERVQDQQYQRFASAHIFPRAHDVEWTNKGYPSRITDPAPLKEMGGSTKIDSLQNMMLLRSDLHNAWDDYQLAVNPDRGYIIVPFVAGYEDVAGKTLRLGHITDPTIRPLDDLFRDHFFQGVLKNMKGVGEPSWDYEDALGDGRMDLSRTDIWGGEDGREHLEFELAHRLHGLVVAQEGLMQH